MITQRIKVLMVLIIAGILALSGTVVSFGQFTFPPPGYEQFVPPGMSVPAPAVYWTPGAVDSLAVVGDWHNGPLTLCNDTTIDTSCGALWFTSLNGGGHALAVAAGSRITIDALPGGPCRVVDELSITAVPEPSAWWGLVVCAVYLCLWVQSWGIAQK